MISFRPGLAVNYQSLQDFFDASDIEKKKEKLIKAKPAQQPNEKQTLGQFCIHWTLAFWTRQRLYVSKISFKFLTYY